MSNQSVQSNSELTPIKIENPLASLRKYYYICMLIGAIALATVGGLGGAVFGAVIGWTIGYFIITIISGVTMTKFNLINYPLSFLMSDELLRHYLRQTFTHPELTINETSSGKVVFTYKEQSTHTVWLDSNKQTFSIITKLTVRNLAKRKHQGGVNEYKYASSIAPIIKNAVEVAANTASQSNESIKPPAI